VCRLCRALVPATELARARHVEWDAKVVMAATVALTNQLSGAGSSDQAGVRGDVTTRLADSPAPATSRPPGPTAQEAQPTEAVRAGAGGPNHHTEAGAAPPRGAATAPGPASPRPGATKRVGRGAQNTGKVASAPAGADPEASDLALFERAQAASDRRWLR
jgi:hypothetical protein